MAKGFDRQRGAGLARGVTGALDLLSHRGIIARVTDYGHPLEILCCGAQERDPADIDLLYSVR